MSCKIERRRRRLQEAKARFAAKAAERLKHRSARKAAQPTPRYDKVFKDGTDILEIL